MSDAAAETALLDLFENRENRMPPEDFILRRIRELVGEGQLEPGMRLPSERALADKLETTRGAVRKALQKLEFYGLVEISPQSGTRIAGMHPNTIEQLMGSIPVSRTQKMTDLMEARFILDVQCARLAAERRSDAAMERMEMKQEEFLTRFYGKGDYLEEDYLFHLAIAQATGNHVLASLFSQLTPRILRQDQPHLKQKDKDFSRIPLEHMRILEAIRRQDPDEAEQSMTQHRNWALKRVFSGPEGSPGRAEASNTTAVREEDPDYGKRNNQ